MTTAFVFLVMAVIGPTTAWAMSRNDQRQRQCPHCLNSDTSADTSGRMVCNTCGMYFTEAEREAAQLQLNFPPALLPIRGVFGPRSLNARNQLRDRYAALAEMATLDEVGLRILPAEDFPGKDFRPRLRH